MHRKFKAFTLIELLVVIAIVGILTGFIFVSMNGAINSAKDTRRQADLATIERAIMEYYTENNNALPENTASCTMGSGGTCPNLSANLNKYLATIPLDPNGSNYAYAYSSGTSSFTIRGTMSNGDTYIYDSLVGQWFRTSSPFVGWLYKKTVTLSATLTQDYQIKLTIPYGSGGCESHCNADFSDLRFATSDGTILNYWIESYTASTTATVWVKALNGSSSFIMCYGKAGVTTTASGDNTFIFFDHFLGSSLDLSKWSITGGTQTVASSILTDTSSSEAGVYEKNGVSTLGTASRMYMNLGSAATSWSRIGVGPGGNNGATFLYYSGWKAETCLTQPDRVWTAISISGGYYVYEITRTNSSSTSFYVGNTLLATNTQKIWAGNTQAFDFYAMNGGSVSVDWVLLRRYQSPEPTGSLGSEQNN